MKLFITSHHILGNDMLASQIVFLQNMEETKKEDLESRKERGHCEEWREAVSDEGSMAA